MEAPGDDVDVVDVVRFAVDVGRGALASVPKLTVPQLRATPANVILWLHRQAQIVC